MTERFNVVAIDPEGFRFGHFLHYFCRLLCGGLESLGYDCVISRNRLDADRTSIVVGGHLLTTLGQVQTIADRGPYVVLQTELIRDGARACWQGSDGFEAVYTPLLRGARAVWEVLPEQMAMHRAIGANAFLLLGGYASSVEQVCQKASKDIDFLFFGSLTAHRIHMLERLGKRGRKLVAVFDDQTIFRNDLIARSRVHLSLRTSDSASHLPWGRICELLNNRALVVAERCANQAWLDDCFVSSDAESWADLCEDTLLRRDRDELALQYWETFKRRPFHHRLERALAGQRTPEELDDADAADCPRE